MVMSHKRFSQHANTSLHLGRWCRVGQDGDIRAGVALSFELRGGLCGRRGGLFRQSAGGLDRCQYAGRVVFAFLDVRLIERVNPQEVACQGRRDFPPEKFSCEIVSVLEREREDWMTLPREISDLSVEQSIPIPLQP
jgi:hypothetical protein